MYPREDSRLRLLVSSLLVLLCVCTAAQAAPVVVSGGSYNDYESDIIRLSDERLLVIFDRNPDWASGDLYATFSTDNGASWEVPQAIISDAGDQATLSFVQTPDDSIRLWYASNETGNYHIYEAISANGLTWDKLGAPDLGWGAAVDYYDPKVILEEDGSFTMSYVVSGSGVYVAHKHSSGNWDTDQTQVSSSGYRARVMKHSNGTYLYAYHKRTGTTSEYDVFIQTSTDRVDWTAPVRLTTNMNSHDPCPGQMADGAYMVYYAKYEAPAYNLHRRRSYNAVDWEPEEKITFDPVNNTQPHFFVESDSVYLVWAYAVSYPNDHDVYFERSADNYSIVSLSPSQNELDVAVGNSISVTFDKDMDSTTINGSSFRVSSCYQGLLPGSVSYHARARTAVFYADADFEVGDVPTVLLSNDIETEYGSPMGRDFSWSFTVEAGGYGGFVLDTTYAVDGWQASVCAADLDGDGAIDLAATSNNYIQLLINNGDGSFTDAGLTQSAWDPIVVGAADLEGDGDMDLIAGSEGGEYETYAVVMLNNGNGTFAGPVSYMAGTPGSWAPKSIVAADFDGDADLDLAIDCPGFSAVAVLLNNGDATFASANHYFAGQDPTCVQTADLDLDGDFDLVTTNEYFGSISILANVGDGTFSIYDTYYPTGGNPVAIAIADFDGDGDLDLATAHEALGLGNFSIGLNQGNGEFVQSANYPTGDVPSALEVGDFDGDGDIDLITANRSANSLLRFSNNGDATFQSLTAFAVAGGPESVASADLDGDGAPDLAVACMFADTVAVLFNAERANRIWYVATTGSDETGNGGSADPFATIQHAIDVAQDGDTVSVAAGTYTGEGNRDLDFNGKGLLLISAEGAQQTIIDCEGSAGDPHIGLNFHTGEWMASVVDGFTITGAYSREWSDSGAVRCYGTSPLIRNCVISGNQGDGVRAGYDAKPLIVNCEISGNYGSGLFIGNVLTSVASVDLSFSLIQGNTGPGLRLCAFGNNSITNCSFIANGDCGILFDGEPAKMDADSEYVTLVTNNIAVYNGTDGMARMMWFPDLYLYCNDAYGNAGGDFSGVGASHGDVNGNISLDPLFCDSAAADYHLQPSSPCAPANNDCGVLMGAFDAGCPDYLCGDADGNEIVNVSDGVYLIAYVFGGPAPIPYLAGDVDCNEIVNISDAVYLITYIFAGGPEPCAGCP